MVMNKVKYKQEKIPNIKILDAMAHEHSKILIYKVCPGKLKDKYANISKI